MRIHFVLLLDLFSPVLIRTHPGEEEQPIAQRIMQLMLFKVLIFSSCLVSLTKGLLLRLIAGASWGIRSVLA